ncbi:putative glucose-6-phosphate 1-epimerase [Phtheirospermum japonicum]|uniref:glucose-6-phosphate 1-epimerase n=1 Tax=Phtheirospermum japonicum TaxID=374723 RepID=A0A830CZP0_9LAMI|nr:putative glucose-6-phosphate 1-epimerase [Phtheirospermum japonicum]
MSSAGAATATAAAEKEKSPIEICKGINGLEKVILRDIRGSSAEIYFYGAQVTSWKNEHREELLFVSSKKRAQVQEKGAPRPFSNLPRQFVEASLFVSRRHFSNNGPLEAHGFARNRFWTIDPSPPPFPTSSSNKTYVDLILKPTEEDMKIWPHSFEFRLRVTLGPAGDLMLTSRIRNTNTDGKPFSFTFAYHTYFSVSDISEVRVEGLETLDYLDSLQNKQRFTEQGDAITFESEVDKIYLSTPTKIAILDHEKKRTFVIRKDGLPDAVVWNPWDKKAKALVDFGDDEYKHMLCIEAAAIEKPITLKPGEEWRGRQELSAVPSSYCSGQLDPRRVLQGS